MRQYNLIVVFSPDTSRLLMCRRTKPPYAGLYNCVGGKIEPGEGSLDAAYRELWEETSIEQGDIMLTHFMDLTYFLDDCFLEVYVGRLKRECAVQGEENELCWLPASENYFDMTRFAGEGNLGHIIEEIRLAWDRLPIGEDKEQEWQSR